MKNRKLRLTQEAKQKLKSELDELINRLYGSPENYEKAKDSNRELSSDREYKIAHECATKGIDRASKQYPSRFKGTRR